MDEIDREILRLLRADGRRAKVEIADHVGLSAPAVNDRIRRLEAEGVIRRYTVELSPEAAGLPEVNFILIGGTPGLDNEEIDDLFTALADIDEVMECHHVAGREDIFLKVRSRSRPHLSDILRRVRRNKGIATTRTMIVLTTYKQTYGVDI